MKILIADDEATNRQLLSAGLRKLGYKVEVTTNGEEAWAALQRADAAELAILDWMMPGMTGPEICLKLRGRENAPYVYVILLTGMSELKALVEGLESGADDFIAKPFRIPELYARLRSGQRVLNLQRELLAGRARIEHLAAHDFLTGLWNRRAIIEKLAHEIARSSRESKPLGVIIMDIDHFKLINDNYGHGLGDLVLQETAKRLMETLRPYDGAGRYGGEEFLVYAADCGMEETVAIAERLRHAMSADPMKVAGKLLRVTASFGAASARPGPAGDIKGLIEAADRALYRAKNLGRNRVDWSVEFDDAQAARFRTLASSQ
jgi:two-component system, cell cycle response regulator